MIRAPIASLTVLFVLLNAAGCVIQPAAHPEKTVPVSNPEYKLEQLFTGPEKYTVYRFYDEGDWRYYVVGPAGAQMLPTTKTVHETETETDYIVVDSDSGGGHGGGRK